MSDERIKRITEEILKTVAHDRIVWAYQKLGVRDALEQFAKELKEEFDAGVIPDNQAKGKRHD